MIVIDAEVVKWIAVLAGALSVFLFAWLILDSIWGDASIGEVKIKRSGEGSVLAGTIVMPEVDVPEGWEPPPILPGD